MSVQPISVAVLGAGGTIAPAIIRDLAGSPEVADLTLLDLDRGSALAAAAEHAGGRAHTRAVDACSGRELAAALADVDMLVNAASYRVNLDAMRACLDAGCHYADLGGLYHVTRRQLKLHDEFAAAGRVAVLGIGSSPGKTNLMARYAVEQLGGAPVASIDVMAGGRDPAAPADGRLRPPYALQTLLDELTLAPIVLRDGEPIEIAPLTDGGAVDFGDPIGMGETIYTLHSELVSFGASFGAAHVSFRLSLAPAVLAGLRELVGAPADAVAAAQASVAKPSDATVSVHLVEVTAGDGRRIRGRAFSSPHFGLGGSIVSTGAPIAAVVRLLARGRVTAVGALAPEACIDPAAMFPELEARGCRFSWQAA